MAEGFGFVEPPGSGRRKAAGDGEGKGIIGVCGVSQSGEQGGAERVVNTGVGFPFDGDGDAFGLKIGGKLGDFIVFPQEDGAVDATADWINLGEYFPDLKELRIDGCVRIFFYGMPGSIAESIPVLRGNAVRIPSGLPFFDRSPGELEGIGQLPYAIEDGVDHFDNGGRRAPRCGEGIRFFDASVVVLVDFVEEVGVASAPAVNGLFGVANVEEAARAGVVHQDFFDKGAEDAPLRSAGVLKFIE